MRKYKIKIINIMANKVQNPEADVMVEAKGKLELFFEKWGNKLLYALVIVAVVVGAFFAYKSYAERREAKKNEAASMALSLATTAETYAQVAADYEGVAAANTAAYLAGAEYLKAGDLENGAKYLEMYEDGEGAAAEMINAAVYGLRGDVAVEKSEYEAAVELYKKAVAASEDAFTHTTYMHKMALVYEAMGDDAQAQQCYKDIVAKYPQTKIQYERYIKE